MYMESSVLLRFTWWNVCTRAFRLCNDCREFEDVFIIQVSLDNLLCIELQVRPISLQVFGHEVLDLCNCCLIVEPKILVFEFSFMNWPGPRRVEVEPGFSCINGKLPKIFFPIRNTFIRPPIIRKLSNSHLLEK